MKGGTDAASLSRHTPAQLMTINFSMAKAELAEQTRS